MYSVIVVDDEKSAREIIVRFIGKMGLDFNVVGDFEHGQSAIDFLKTTRVNLVITDIKMPKVNGIELTEYIYNNHPSTKVVILSGYGEFEYARQALNYGVINYMLKPLNLKEFMDTLTRIKGLFDQKILLDKNDDEGLLERREQLFVDLTMGAYDDLEQFENEFKKLDFPFSLDDSKGEVIEVSILDYESIEHFWHYGKERLLVAMLNILKDEYFKANVYSINANNSKFRYIILGEYKEFNSENIKNLFKDLLNVEAEIKLVKTFPHLWELSCENLADNDQDEIALMLSHIIDGNKKSAVSILSNVMKNINKIDDDITMDKDMKKNLIQLFQFVGKLIDYKEDNCKDSINYIKISYRNLQKTINEYIKRLETTNNKTNVIIESAKAFIVENYKNDITRNDVARHVFLNSAYFSRYFKKETGENFYDYLVGVRMRKAIELLGENVKVNEVCERVGYISLTHFRKMFKKYTSYSPTEYKRHVLKIEDGEDEI